tara:strand:- start:10494 stop:11441 length:948 start_codon:yes stop_codon:yes gene_type:complete
MKILVTGAAGFIGYHLCKSLCENHEVVGVDSLNSYYDVSLKKKRLENLNKNFVFKYFDCTRKTMLDHLFLCEKFDVVIHLAAQAGVRYSLEHPEEYIDSNVVGFHNVIQLCVKHKIKEFLYASSSSVYGDQTEQPFNETQKVDKPVSIYAATKKANELIAYSYSHLYNIKTIGMRFFTVYGSYGRPDMAIYLFTDAIANNKPIKVFNNGDLFRDFTHVKDVVKGIEILLNNNKIKDNYNIFNIANGKSEKLESFINEIEINLNKKAKRINMSMQSGDVKKTWANIDKIKELGYSSKVSIKEGVKEFVDWYKKRNE